MGALILGGGALVLEARAVDAGRPGPPPAAVIANDAKVAAVGGPGGVDLAQHIDPNGGYTIFAFGADW